MKPWSHMKVDWKLPSVQNRHKARPEYPTKSVSFTTLKAVMSEASNSRNSTSANYMKLLQLKSTWKLKNRLRKKTTLQHLHWNLSKCKPTPLWQSATSSWRTSTSQKNTSMNTTEWLRSQRLKIMSQTVLTIWLSYLSKRIRARKPSSSTRRILKPPSHRNRTRRIAS